MQAFGIFFSVLIWYFVSRVVNAPPTTPGLEGVDYFAYVLLGLALFVYLSSAMISFGGKVRSEQMTGTLEAMLVTPTSIGTIVGGVFYPPQDMPVWLGGWSRLLPITYALHALRRALLRGSRFADLLPDIRALVLFAAVLLPLGILAFRFAVRKARQEGSLVQY